MLLLIWFRNIYVVHLITLIFQLKTFVRRHLLKSIGFWLYHSITYKVFIYYNQNKYLLLQQQWDLFMLQWRLKCSIYVGYDGKWYGETPFHENSNIDLVGLIVINCFDNVLLIVLFCTMGSPTYILNFNMRTKTRNYTSI